MIRMSCGKVRYGDEETIESDMRSGGIDRFAECRYKMAGDHGGG